MAMAMARTNHMLFHILLVVQLFRGAHANAYARHSPEDLYKMWKHGLRHNHPIRNTHKPTRTHQRIVHNHHADRLPGWLGEATRQTNADVGSAAGNAVSSSFAQAADAALSSSTARRTRPTPTLTPTPTERLEETNSGPIEAWPTWDGWPKFPTRTSLLLDGKWRFVFVGNVPFGAPLDALKPPTRVEAATAGEDVSVPSVFDNTPPGVRARRGVAWYIADVPVPAGRAVLLHFHACAFYCRIFVDGVPHAQNKVGGYSGFWVAVNAASSRHGRRRIAVLSDNRYSAVKAPTHTGGDFYMHGGLHRSVIAHILAPDTSVAIRRTEVSVANLDERTVVIRVTLAAFPIGGRLPETASLRVQFSNGDLVTFPTAEVVQMKGSDALGYTSIIATLPKDASGNLAKLWSPKNPQLQTLTLQLMESAQSNRILDAALVRFGMRTVSVLPATQGDVPRIALNGEAIKLVGFNRHTSTPESGSAMTRDEHQRDIELLLGAGANFVRGAHYPQDPRFLDLCDERGILVWEETLGPSVEVSHLKDEYFMKYQLAQAEAMVAESFNHPSVIIFAYYNEGPSDREESRAGYTRMSRFLHRRDPTRLVTYASSKGNADRFLDTVDIISLNNYPGWYHGFGPHGYGPNFVKRYWTRQVALAQRLGKPLLISEAGAGAIHEWKNNRSDVKWGQAYQAGVVKATASVACENSAFSGVALWQFADIKANDISTNAGCGCVEMANGQRDCAHVKTGNCTRGFARPKGENNKGVVDFWRRPKVAYEAAKSVFRTCR